MAGVILHTAATMDKWIYYTKSSVTLFYCMYKAFNFV